MGQFHDTPAQQTVYAMGGVLIDLGQAARFERLHIGAEQL
jgi:hypothetical protein